MSDVTTASGQKILGLGDITILTLTANFGVRWLAVAAGLGAASVSFWIIGAVMLAMPLAFMSGRLSQLFPEEGGIYAWTRRSLGEKNGFVVAWLYFLNNILYYPAVLIFLATNFAFFLGKPALANNSTFVCVTVLIAFWLLVLISVFGLKTNKWVTKYGGIIGSIAPAVLIIALGFILFFVTKHSATVFNLQTIIPNHDVSKNLANLTMIMFAMTGVEIIPTFANAVKNPKRDLYWGLIIGATCLVVLYAVGTIALNLILNPDDVRKASGFMSAFQLVCDQLHMAWLSPTVALLLVFSELGIVSMWLIAPITMFFKCTPDGLLPTWFHQTNQKGAPVNALLFTGLLVTIMLLTTNLLPAINDVYQILILMSVLLAFIPYLFMLAAYVKNIKLIGGNLFFHYFFSVTVFISLILGIIFSFELPHNIVTLTDKIFYEAELFLGPLVFMWLGYVVYGRWARKQG